jgi:UrcA family protein
MSYSKLHASLLAATLGLAVIAAPAAADVPPGAGVSYSDLDLSDPAGIEALNRRVQAAANRLCAPQRHGPAPWGPIAFRRCVGEALASARPQVAAAVARASGTQLAGRDR